MFLAVQSVRKPQSSDILQRVSVVPNGVEDNDSSYGGQFSMGGRYIVFTGEADLVPNVPYSGAKVFLRDTLTGTTSLVSVTREGVQASGDSYGAAISANGRFVVFNSEASNLVTGDTNNDADIFLKDLSTGVLTRVSTSSGGGQAARPSENPQISADGRYVVFESYSEDLVPGTTPSRYHIYRKDTWTGITELVSANQTRDEGADISRKAQISADGNYVVFESRANNLVEGDGNGRSDIFVKNMRTGAVTLVSSSSNNVIGNEDSANAHITLDGRYVVFENSADKLVSGDTNGMRDVFRKDLLTGQITLVSAAGNNAPANGNSEGAKISADGRYVIFRSDATNLGTGGPAGTKNVFVKDLVTGALTALSTNGVSADEDDAPHISPDGRYALFTSSFDNLVPGDTNGLNDVFRVDLLYKANATAIAEGRFIETTLSVGGASSASIAWGDGTSSTVTPTGGSASFHHAYASTGTKAAIVSLVEGALTWNVAHTVDVGAGTMARNTALADTLSGGAGGDSLVGDGFANILLGNGGNDRLTASAGNDQLDAGAGNDRLYGDSGNDSLVGGSGNDLLSASLGNDRLIGGTGKDTLTGSTGRDVFVFDDRETGSSKSRADYITDFSGRRGDKIDLKGVDANTKKRGDQKFSFIGDEQSFSKAGEVRFEKTKSATYVYLNTDSDRAAEAVIKLKGSIELSKSWFVL